jgi:predicted GNAT family acetyltransferase
MPLSIKVDENNNKFFVMVEGQEAMISFKILPNGILDFHHTFVPSRLRNRGIAAELVAFALGYARKHGQNVVPTCPYVRDYVDQHNEWRDIVVD